MRERAVTRLAEVAARLAADEPTARIVLWSLREDARAFGVGAQRLDVVIAYPRARHDGLRHWRDEWSWYVGDIFVHVLEVSKFARLGLKGHPLFEAMMHRAVYTQSITTLCQVRAEHASLFDAMSSWVDVCRRFSEQDGG